MRDEEVMVSSRALYLYSAVVGFIFEGNFIWGCGSCPDLDATLGVLIISYG